MLRHKAARGRFSLGQSPDLVLRRRRQRNAGIRPWRTSGERITMPWLLRALEVRAE